MKIRQPYDFLLLWTQRTKMKFRIGIDGIAIEELENSIISNKFVRLDVYGVLLKNNESYGVKLAGFGNENH